MTVSYRISPTRTKYTKYGIYADLNITKYYTNFMYSICINYASIKQMDLFVVLNCYVAFYTEICDNETKKLKKRN